MAFLSRATNLVSDDSNEATDIFVHDRTAGVTTRVSVDSSGAQANEASHLPSISADGRYVTFLSSATNLVSRKNKERVDIFVHDRNTGFTSLVSASSSGQPGNDRSFPPTISTDGRFITFSSLASNLAINDENHNVDVFVAAVDVTAPAIAKTDLAGSYNTGISSFSITFEESMYDPKKNTDQHDITNPHNYLLVESSHNKIFDTLSCSGDLTAGDTWLMVNSISYTLNTSTAQIIVNHGKPLPAGTYRLFVCNSIADLAGNRLNGGTDSWYELFVVKLPKAAPQPAQPAE